MNRSIKFNLLSLKIFFVHVYVGITDCFVVEAALVIESDSDKMLRGTVISYDWYKTAEGQGLLAHLTDPSTGYRQPITA